jgi:hypothetical protein
MAVKSAYKPKPSSPVDLPKVTIDGKEPESIAAVSVDLSPGEEPSEAVQEALQEAAQADEAAAALKKQIEAVYAAEETQRQAALAANIHRLPLDEKIKIWQANGLSDAEADFLRQNPEVANHPEVSGWAANKAMHEGHQRDSAAYFQAVEENFQAAMRHMQAQASSPQVPEFFRAPPPRQPMPRTPAHFVSAPVTRGDVPDGTPRQLNNPGKVTLTAEQREAAKLSGITEVEYARHLLRLQKEKAAGMRQT